MNNIIDKLNDLLYHNVTKMSSLLIDCDVDDFHVVICHYMDKIKKINDNIRRAQAA